MTDALDFLVRKDDVRTTRWAAASLAPLKEGEALLRLDRFALTANNITYAVMGEGMRYWNFFPAADGWGRVPVWGFCEVIESRAAGVSAGQRFYGYMPMSTHLVVQPARADAASFIDGAPHRANLPAIYNQYLRAGAGTEFATETETYQALLRPLFFTSFLLDDFLADNDFFGARRVLIVSASSKTAIGLAFALARRKSGVKIVGLTSARSEDFVKSLGTYDEVVLYDDIANLPLEPSVTIDMSGSFPVRQGVHERLGDALKYDCAVGATHWDAPRAPAKLPGPAPVMFFAPDVARKRVGEWGADGLDARYQPVWEAFLTSARGWLEAREARGRESVEAAYREVVEGRSSPQTGHVLSLN